MTTFKDFPKLEDWSYVDLVTFYNKAISWKITVEKELRKKLRSNRPYGPSPMTKELIKEILGIIESS